MTVVADYETFLLPNFKLQCGITLPEAILAYKTYGKLNSDRSNVILYPTSYGAQHPDIEWLIEPGGILDSEKYLVIITNMFGNGLSSSPSNLPELFTGPRRPHFTHVDNVIAQHTLLKDVYDIEKLALVYGWSMGGQQALHWGAIYPTEVERIAAVCTSARTSPHNFVFLEGLKTALQADPAWNGTHFTSKPEQGLRAFARIYAGWALSQLFYREHVYREHGYSSLEDFLIRDWEASFLHKDPMNLLSMIETWQTADISRNDLYQGDFQKALRSITARTLLMPCNRDLYFPPEDNEYEVSFIPNGELRPIDSVWGHRAGNPKKSPADQHYLKKAIAELLSA
ncbi:MAG: alpha/beta fold hydrolase [Planctomycetaceae bacterium]